MGGGHGLTHSRSSSNLGGDDGDRDLDWEDDDAMNTSVMTGIGMGGSQGGEEWDAQSPNFTFGANNGLCAPNFTFSALGAAPGGDDWKRWAECEINKERKRVQRLVGVVKALVHVTGRGGATASGGTTPNISIELDGSKCRLRSYLCMLSRMISSAEHHART